MKRMLLLLLEIDIVTRYVIATRERTWSGIQLILLLKHEIMLANVYFLRASNH